MSLGEYTPNSNTKLLLHLNGNSTDSSGNSNNGTDTAITYSQANGKFGQGAGFNGSTSKISGETNLGIDGGNITMSIWSYITDNTVSSSMVPISQSSATSFTKYEIYYTPTTNSLEFYRTKNFVGGQGFTVTKNINSGWHNLILTYNGTNVIGYLDGASVGSNAASGSGTTAGHNGWGVGVHHRESSPEFDAYWKGNLDEAIIENTAWIPQQVQKYYTNSKGRFIN